MEKIEFVAAYGQERKNAKITAPNGGGSILHFFINNYYQGMFVRISNNWVPYLNDDECEFTSDDIAIICEIIDEHF